MAMGLNGSWGVRTELDPNRQVSPSRYSTSMDLAARLRDKMSAEDIQAMPDDQLSQMAGGGAVDKRFLANLIRIHRSYQ